MPAAFYDHPVTGKLHIRAPAGGGGSEFDGPATEADIRNHAEAHQRYLAEKHAARDHAAQDAAHDAAVEETKAEIEHLTEEKAALEEQVEHLADAAEKL